MKAGITTLRLARTRRSPLSGGFTLIELIVVMVIVAILAGVAMPALSTMNDTRSGLAARQIVRDMTFARQRAVSVGLNSWVVFNTSQGAWSVLSESRQNPGFANAAVLDDPASGKAFVRHFASDFPGVSITACNFNGAAQVGFDWRGEPLRPNGTALTSQGSITLSGGHTVVVEAVTGHIRYLP